MIEDEPLLLKAMRRILKDHEVVSFSDAREALALLERGEEFDIIFSDMMMPMMTGMDFYERLVSTRPEIAPRMVFITGGSVTAPIDAFLGTVPNVRLEKPVGSDAMRSFVQARLAGTLSSAD